MVIKYKSGLDIGLYVLWDIDKPDLDFEKDKDFIICRHFESGKLEDVLKIISYYGLSYSKKVLVANKYLSLPGIYLAQTLLNIPIDQLVGLADYQDNLLGVIEGP